MRTAVITGGTRGLGRELVERLAADGWSVTFDARSRVDVENTVSSIGTRGHVGTVTGIAGDVADPTHRAEIAAAVEGHGLDLLVNNAGTLGPSPLPRLTELDPDELTELFDTNTIAPLALTRALLDPLERAKGIVVNISSDAAVEAYGGWGGYGASKTALDHITRVLAVEHPALGWYSFDPGEMRTEMHQAAFPGEDISDRPLPSSAASGLLRLVALRPPSGRYAESDLSVLPVLR